MRQFVGSPRPNPTPEIPLVKSSRRTAPPLSYRDQLRAWSAAERGAIIRDAPRRVAVCYPNRYAVAASSLGYQVVYRLINARPGWAAERAVFPDRPELLRAARQPLLTLETMRPVGGFDAIAFSVAYELDVPHVPAMLELSGVPGLASDRNAAHPFVLAGGPITQSNALPLGPFVDAMVIGDGEYTLPEFLGAWERSSSRQELLEALAVLPGFWVPTIHHECTCDVIRAPDDVLPALGQIVSPHAELGDMFLIETSRGCTRMCAFCVVRAAVSPMRGADPAAVLDAIPAWAPRVGYVGAAVSDYPHIKEVLRGALALGKGISVSSLRADRLDEEFVDLLRQGGYRTLTVASDAPSERQRSKLMKGIRERHLLRAAVLAKWAKLRLLKMYMIVGLPDETDDDITELLDFCRRCSDLMPMALALSPFVPKLHTPLCAAPFEEERVIRRRLDRIRKELGGKVDVRSASGKWAWVEYRLSQGGIESGLAAWSAYQNGNGYAAYKSAFGPDQRPALEAARRHGVWEPTGIDKSKARPPRPPKRLDWNGVHALDEPVSELMQDPA